jgi:hypothetical protein
METIDTGVSGRRPLHRRHTRRHVRPAKKRRKRLTSRDVCARYNVCTRTIDRWVADPRLAFPKPLVIRRRRYWDEDELDKFEATQIEASA